MTQQNSISRNEAIELVMGQLNGPTNISDVIKQVLDIWFSSAKKPEQGVRQAMRGWDHFAKTLIFLDKDTVAPINIALQGVTFRIPLSRQEVKHGVISVSPNFTGFLTYKTPAETVELLDATGQPIPVELLTTQEKRKSLLGGAYTVEHQVFKLDAWLKKRNVKRGDCLLVTIDDWENKRFRLAHEPAKARKRHQAEIQAKNEEMANILFELLETAKYEYIAGENAAVTAYARLADSTGYPGDHWLQVVKNDERMRWDGTDIRYSDHQSLIGTLLGEAAPTPAPVVKASAEQKQQVYVFKAAFKYRKGLWRCIEILGGQTLADFDRQLRLHFEHDYDHMSGFWKLIKRGKGNKGREIDLGSLNPFGEGEMADKLIAELDLNPEDRLKYVYDFGDWIEHDITLEAINAPEEGIKYPRLASQNKPRYKYCQHCKDNNQKTVAIRVCIECPDQEHTDVLTCSPCLSKHHEEHYTDELIY